MIRNQVLILSKIERNIRLGRMKKFPIKNRISPKFIKAKVVLLGSTPKFGTKLNLLLRNSRIEVRIVPPLSHSQLNNSFSKIARYEVRIQYLLRNRGLVSVDTREKFSFIAFFKSSCSDVFRLMITQNVEFCIILKNQFIYFI